MGGRAARLGLEGTWVESDVLFRDAHPALYALDEDADGLAIRYRYLGDGTVARRD